MTLPDAISSSFQKFIEVWILIKSKTKAHFRITNVFLLSTIFFLTDNRKHTLLHMNVVTDPINYQW